MLSVWKIGHKLMNLLAHFHSWKRIDFMVECETGAVHHFLLVVDAYGFVIFYLFFIGYIVEELM